MMGGNLAGVDRAGLKVNPGAGLGSTSCRPKSAQSSRVSALEQERCTSEADSDVHAVRDYVGEPFQ